ncbi:MAG: bacillithiol biosynthesis cysteine-adding enzyme BshC [Flavobacteriaceae bacterium]|nr:bacillithiol biosynthesis cysteine-adding enzyme BshC [Flavobacteriaceae bacterium]
MSVKTIPYTETNYFSKLVGDYLAEKPELQSFYHRFPKLENFEGQLEEKQKSLRSDINRNRSATNTRLTLVNVLNNQYQNLAVSEATQNNINSLTKETTFTITTGHQLNLFTGPLYFLYKIFSVINLSGKLNKKHPSNHFAPVYWMATEDHDFDEINYFNLFGKKIEWKRTASGAVGELSTEGLEELLKELESELGASENAQKLIQLFSEAYIKHNNLTDATRYLANELFSDYGLIIIDGNDHDLKQQFIPFAKKELTENLAFHVINKTTEKLESVGYKKQVNPREINLFYLKKNLRERIVKKEGVFKINNTELTFSKEEILKELQNFPERFSPNALLRPLFQEIVLPNLCYVGGGGELAYWFQLKDYFKSVEVTFPILLLRNSVLLVPKRLSKKLEKLNENIEALFFSQYDLENKHTLQLSDIKIDFTQQREHLKKQFEDLYEVAKKTDQSFLGAVAAQEKKQLNGLDKLEKRFLKAEKRKLVDQLNRLTSIQNKLFPKESLQERTVNFSELYLEFGDGLLKELKGNLDSLVNEFTVLEL